MHGSQRDTPVLQADLIGLADCGGDRGKDGRRGSGVGIGAHTCCFERAQHSMHEDTFEATRGTGDSE
jgi:hypothetical protein